MALSDLTRIAKSLYEIGSRVIKPNIKKIDFSNSGQYGSIEFLLDSTIYTIMYNYKIDKLVEGNCFINVQIDFMADTGSKMTNKHNALSVAGNILGTLPVYFNIIHKGLLQNNKVDTVYIHVLHIVAKSEKEGDERRAKLYSAIISKYLKQHNISVSSNSKQVVSFGVHGIDVTYKLTPPLNINKLI